MTTNAISSLAAGWRTTCGVFNDQLQCFGWNQYGQIGIGPNGNQFRPVAIDVSASSTSRELQEFDQLSLGVVHTCATTKDAGKLYCWGSNDSVNLLLKRPVSYFTPQPISSLGGEGVFQDADTQVLQLSAGRSHNCAVISYPFDLQKERFVCWGSNEAGQLGIGSTDAFDTPVEVASNIDSITLLPQQISSGYSHQCAIQAVDNSLWCWGLNTNGQVGVGTNENVLTPTKISQLGAVSVVAAGSYHTCVIAMGDDIIKDTRDDNGGSSSYTSNVYCFGSNSFGQLGIGSRDDQSLPQQVNLGGMAKEVQAGRDHTCAIMEDDTVKCWGSNFSGQLGVGNNPNLATVPMRLLSLNRVEKLALGREHTCASTSGALWCWGTNSHGQLGLGEEVPNQYLPQMVPIEYKPHEFGGSPPPTESPTEPPSIMAPSSSGGGGGGGGPSKVPPREPTFEPTGAPSKQPTPRPSWPAIPIPTPSPVNILEPTNTGILDTPTLAPTRNRLQYFPTPEPTNEDDEVPTSSSDGGGGGQSIIIIVPTTETTIEELDNSGVGGALAQRYWLLAALLPLLFSAFRS